MRGRARILSEADLRIWAEAVRTVERLRRAVPASSPPNPAPAPTPPPPAPTPAPVTAAPPAPVRIDAAAPGALVVGTRGLGLDDGSWRALGSGRLAPDRRLDLHGRTANDALAVLSAFLARASADRVRCVEIVTGRGSGERGGVLRRELPHWLNRPELRRLVVAASEAQPGNPGALRLILRRRTARPRPDPR